MEVRPQPSRMCQLFWCTLLQDSPLRFWCCTDVLIIYTVALECVYGTVIIPKLVYLFFWPSLGLLQHTAIDSPTIYQLSIVLESPLVLLQTEDGVPSSVNPVAFNPCWSLPLYILNFSCLRVFFAKTPYAPHRFERPYKPCSSAVYCDTYCSDAPATKRLLLLGALP